MAEGQKYHCGPKNAPRWVRRILSMCFNSACYTHDINFSKDTKLSQKEANEVFLIDMVRQSGLNPFKLLFAITFFWAVEFQGDKHYEGSVKQ